MGKVAPEIQAIIEAWISGKVEEAIALTNAIAQTQRRCVVCGKPLARQAKGAYCKQHQHKNPVQKERVKTAKSKARAKKN